MSGIGASGSKSLWYISSRACVSTLVRLLMCNRFWMISSVCIVLERQIVHDRRLARS